MTYLTFDRLKIKANYKYLLERQIQFNQTYNSKNGELTGLYYSSKNDKSVPFNLYIAVSKPKQTLTLEFSSKILGEDYPKLISKYTIRQCLENINKLGICRIDVDGILQTGCITSADVTKDVHATLSDETLHALSLWVKNYRRYKWDYYDSEGIDFIRDVKSSKCKECIRIYRKEKEIIKPKNKDFLSILPNKWEVVKQFNGVTRFEVKLETIGKVRSYLNLRDTYINEVLNAEANLILTMYDRVFGHTSDVPEIQADTFDDFAMQKILNAYHGDIKTIEMTLKPLYASRSGFDKRMTKIRQTWEKMLNSTSGGINYVNSVRNLLV